MEEVKKTKEITFFQALLPIIFLFLIVFYGLILRPVFLSQPAFPLEFVFITAATFAIAELKWLGFGWDEILESIVQK